MPIFAKSFDFFLQKEKPVMKPKTMNNMNKKPLLLTALIVLLSELPLSLFAYSFEEFGVYNNIGNNAFSNSPMQSAPVMEPKLDYGSLSNYRPELELRQEPPTPLAKKNWTWMRTNSDVRPNKVMDDLSFVGLPLFAAGWIIKGDKASFRQDYNNPHSNTRLVTNFKTGIDDYTQYFGPAMTVGLKVGGYEGRSDWGRLLASAAISYGIMAGFVNGIKYTASEMRPDGSTANS